MGVRLGVHKGRTHARPRSPIAAGEGSILRAGAAGRGGFTDLAAIA